MVALNQLFSECDLAAMTADQRQFLIDRIEHYFGSPEVMSIVADKLQDSVKHIAPDVKLHRTFNKGC